MKSRLRRRSLIAPVVRGLLLAVSLPAVALAQQAKPAPAPAQPAPPAAQPAAAAPPAAAPPAATPPPPAPPPGAAPPAATAPAAATAAPATPAPPPTASPASEAPAPETLPAPADPAPAIPADTSAEDEALLSELKSEITHDEYKLDVYGFVDFTYGHRLADFSFSAPYNSFAVGNFNLYLGSELGDNWRSLAEVRFTYLPHGNRVIDATGATTRTDTTAADYTDIDRPIRWGGVIIERAWLEYSAHPLLTVRGGHWLTPYGIWNVDHGTPVIIGVRRPFVVGEALFPTSQTGIELYGTHGFGELLLGYHLTLSNGRGPVDRYQDLNDNKALGGRLFARLDSSSVGTLTLGVSGYRGDYTDRDLQFGLNADGDYVANFPRTVDYDELSYAADLKWDFEGFWLQSEAIVHEAAYEEGMRPAQQVFGAAPGFMPDYRRLGVYGLTGYRFDFIGLMPFTGAEYYDLGGGGFVPDAAAVFLGLNARPTARVVLKVQYTYSWFPNLEDPPENSHYNSIDFQTAWSF
jgi:hypothetical protein